MASSRPNSLKIEKETTHVHDSWRRVASMAPRAGTTTLFVEAPKGEFSFPPFLEAKVDVTTKHWFSSSAHDSYARTMMLAGEVAADPFDGDASADPRRGAW